MFRWVCCAYKIVENLNCFKFSRRWDYSS